MKNKLILLILGMFLISFAYAVGEVSYCCEKTVAGAWCQNAPEEQCSTEIDSLTNTHYKKVPASCEATSYCKLGTCISEGDCMGNTPERRCDKELGGYWEGKDADEIPQCKLGCCLIGNQAAFVTQTRCKKLSAIYGLETNFRTDITNELSCIASAMSDVKGACVYEEDFSKTCQFLTKKECSELSVGNGTEFYEGVLCSSETLGTDCGKSKETTCVEGRDEVYFLDTCGNLANIYDADKWNNELYWTYVAGTHGVVVDCGSGGNADNPSCGNCDYFLGSTCKAYKRGQNTNPTYGDNICRDLSCEYKGNTYQHGETWCAESAGVSSIRIDDDGKISSSGVSSYGKDLPGSRYFRLVCYNNEVTIEQCADFRQEVCLQSDIAGFKTAACRVNMWQDCFSQNTSKDCNNIDKRDCQWVNSKCVPLYAPGFDFWDTTGKATSTCALASKTCTVTYKKEYDHTFGDLKTTCTKNCDCVQRVDDKNFKVSQTWKNDMMEICIKRGDCGSSVNYIGQKGYK